MQQFCKQIFKLQFLLIITAILAGVYYPQIVEQLTTRFWTGEKVPVQFEQQTTAESSSSIGIYTRDELAQRNGKNGTPLYLALLGSVYDVSRGEKHYGAGAAYNFFVGRDASVSFVTGEFEHYVEGRADDVLALQPSELLSLDNWKRFYDKDYTYKGKLVGRFYDATGAPTAYYHKYQARLEQAKELKAAEDSRRLNYPDCNIEWSEERGTHVWCTPTSGGSGQKRDWAGHPRKLYEVGGNEKFRCACIRTEELESRDVMIKSYDNCQHLANECYYHLEE